MHRRRNFSIRIQRFSLLALLIYHVSLTALATPSRRSDATSSSTSNSRRPVTIGPAPIYTVSDLETSSTGFVAQLTLTNPGAGAYGAALPSLTLTGIYETSTRAHFRLLDPNNARYEIPQSVLPYPRAGSRDLPLESEKGSYQDNPAYVVEVSNVGEILSLTVTRTVDSSTIFTLGDLDYSDQFLQLSNILPEESDQGAPFIYGLGEHVMTFQLPTDDHSFTMWNVDIPTPFDQNIYGSHPFYLQTLAAKGLAHGMFVRSSNGMDVIVSQSKVTFKIIGGILEWYIFAGSAHEEVIQQYHSVIGQPHLPPYWSFGWQQCQYGWHTLSEVASVVSNYSSYAIPLETIYTDADYMVESQDFTWDPIRFPLAEVQAFAQQLHAAEQHYVVIVRKPRQDAEQFDRYSLLRF